VCGSRNWSAPARSRHEWIADGLRPTSHPPGDRKRAIAILCDALEEAGEYSMKGVQADALALKLDLEAPAPASPLGEP